MTSLLAWANALDMGLVNPPLVVICTNEYGKWCRAVLFEKDILNLDKPIRMGWPQVSELRATTAQKTGATGL